MNILIASTTKIKETNVNDKFEKRVNLCGFDAFYEYLFTLHLPQMSHRFLQDLL